MLTLRQVAKRLNVSRQYIHALCKRLEIQPRRIENSASGLGFVLLFSPAQVRKLEEHKSLPYQRKKKQVA